MAAGGPILPGAAVAGAPAASSNDNVSIPSDQPLMCSNNVSPPRQRRKSPSRGSVCGQWGIRRRSAAPRRYRDGQRGVRFHRYAAAIPVGKSCDAEHPPGERDETAEERICACYKRYIPRYQRVSGHGRALRRTRSPVKAEDDQTVVRRSRESMVGFAGMGDSELRAQIWRRAFFAFFAADELSKFLTNSANSGLHNHTAGAQGP